MEKQALIIFRGDKGIITSMEIEIEPNLLKVQSTMES